MPDAKPLHAPTPMAWRIALGAGVLVLGFTAFALQESIGPRGQGCFGLFCVLGLVATFSANLRAVSWRAMAAGFVLQWLLAFLILRFEINGLEALGIPDGLRPGYALFAAAAQAVNKFLEFPAGGLALLFGKLVDEATMKRLFNDDSGIIFGLGVLPAIIFVSSFFTVLYYFGLLQWIVRVCARVMTYFMGTSGAETLAAIANVFMGQTEAPLIVKPYILKMTQSELLALMVGGMATISGGLMAAYIKMGADAVAILATSVMAAPCGLYLSKLLLPELEEPETRGLIKTDAEMPYRNAIDAAATGASDGLYLVLNVAAMLIAFMGIIAMINFLLGQFPTHQEWNQLGDWFDVRQGWHAVGNWLLTLVAYAPLWLLGRKFWSRRFTNETPARFGAGQLAVFALGYALFLMFVALAMVLVTEPLSLNWLFSQCFAPLAFLMGVEPRDVPSVANLLGTKLAVNEFVAYIELGTTYRVPAISARSHKLATYALTGFANFASIGIQIGGIGALAPSRRSDLARLGLRALFVGFLATILNATVAGILLDE
ncbi:MAG: NupC/NupG family nucleoside CNT transporter [Planctomycetes bacterium]|nr:NupC/NupG family nucleoside CNT transporter [Planctomycetota bacterium]